MMQQIWWFATRSAGLLTWFASTASVIVGLLLASRALGRRPSGPWLLDVHRYLGAMTMVFLALHMVTLWADSYVQFGPAELFIPGASAWRTGAVAWGVVAAWILVGVEASSLVKDRLPPRLWHGIHLGSFAVMGMGTIHGWQAGSDVRNLLVLAVAVLMAVGVIGLSTQRLRLRARAAWAREERRAALARVRATARSTSADPSRPDGPQARTPSGSEAAPGLDVVAEPLRSRPAVSPATAIPPSRPTAPPVLARGPRPLGTRPTTGVGSRPPRLVQPPAGDSGRRDVGRVRPPAPPPALSRLRPASPPSGPVVASTIAEGIAGPGTGEQVQRAAER